MPETLYIHDRAINAPTDGGVRRAAFNSALGARVFYAALALFATLGGDAHARFVRFDTSLGVVDVRLYDRATPASAQNFLNYVEDGDYDGTFIHRSVPGFIVQGGGFIVDDSIFTAEAIPKDDPVVNEFGISNLRGTVSFAKVAAEDDMGNPIPGGGPDSATNQWFFSVDDNSANLDSQNGGFTVFARVVGDGMSVVDAINDLPRINAGGAFSNVPVTDLDAVQAQQDITIDEAVVVHSVVLLDLHDADFNRDGVVDALDYTVWRDTNGSTTDASADANGNSIVNIADYDIWAAAYGATAASGAAATSLPEPGAAALLLLGLATVGRIRRRPATV